MYLKYKEANVLPEVCHTADTFTNHSQASHNENTVRQRENREVDTIWFWIIHLRLDYLMADNMTSQTF